MRPATRRFGAFLAARPNADTMLGVTALALAIRLIAVLATIHHLRISADAADYLRLAHSLNAGHGWGQSHVAPGGGPEGLRPPGYPIWLAAVFRLTGGGLTAARLVGAGVGSLVPALIVAIALLTGMGRRVSIVAGALAAILPSLIIASLSPMSESVFVPMSLGVVVAALAYRRDGHPAQLATAGVLLGFATLVRPVGVVLAIPVIVLALRAPARGPRRIIGGLVAAALAIVPCAAWELREINDFHTVVPLTTQGGYLLAGTYDATSAHVPGDHGVWIPYILDPSENALIQRHPHANEAQVSGLLDHAAVHYLVHHPSYDVTVLTQNTLRLFDLGKPSFERTTTESEYGVGSLGGWAENVGGMAILLLAVAGALQGAVRRRDWPVWIAPLLLVLVTIPVQSFTRFRAPIDPYLVLLAAVALARIRLPRRPADGVVSAPDGGSAVVGGPVPVDRPAMVGAAAVSTAPASASAVSGATSPIPDAQPTPHIASLTGLRFAAALGVFMVHTGVLLDGFFPHGAGYGRVVTAGASGVSFFFILSGFVLTWSHRPGDTTRQFIRRRAGRILPNHALTWAATAVLYAAIGLTLPTGPALTSLVLVHAWVPILSWYNGMDTPSWSLCCEAFFYVLFPVLLIWLRRCTPRQARLAAAAGLGVALAAAIAAGPLAHATSADVGNWLVVDLPVTRLGEFVLGIVLALELQRGTLPRIRPALAALSVAAALTIVDVANTQHLLVVVPVLPFAALIAAAARSELAGGLRWLRHPIAVRLGQWSFAFYLVHWLVLVEVFHLHPHRYTAWGAIGVVAAALVASVAISAAVFELWERPMERALRPQHREALVTAASGRWSAAGVAMTP